MSGTSVTSSIGWKPRATSIPMAAAVVTITAPRVHIVGRTCHTRNPYRRVRLTQMKWNGTVSQSGSRSMATRLRAEKAIHAASTQCRPKRASAASGCIDAVPLSADRDDGIGAELGPEPADVDVHDV